MALEDKDRRRIFGCAKQHGIDKETLHDIVYQCTKKDSITKLEKADVQAIIDRIEGKKPQTDKNKISYAQNSLMHHLAREIGYDEDKLINFVKRNTGVDVITWLNKVQASDIIEGLKKIKQRKKEEKTSENQ